MAERLIQSGFEVTACDKSEAARAVFTQMNVSTVTHASACVNLEALIIMVANDGQLRQVVSDDDGILAGVRSGPMPRSAPLRVMIMSSVLPQTVKEVGSLLAQNDIRVIDAPVSGGAVRAANGSLTIMTGGEPADVDAVRPVLSALGEKVFHCGPLGAAESVKIMNNIVGITNTFLMVEVSRIAQQLGIDLPWLAGVMEASSGRNYATLNYEEHRKFYAVTGKDLPTLKAIVDICRKDLALGAALAGEVKVATPLLDAIAQANRAVSYEELLKDWQSLRS